VLNFLLGWYLEVWPGGAVARSRCAPAHPLHTSCWGRRQCDRTPGLARAVGAGELSADVPPPRGLHADAVRTKGAQNRPGLAAGVKFIVTPPCVLHS
jgi:hypothetical protein